jgi:predicted nuclease with TOPRIM domain
MFSHMKSNNPRIERLKEMMTLEERRGQLQAELDELSTRMNDLKDRLFEESAEVQSTTASSTRSASPAKSEGSSTDARKRARKPAQPSALLGVLSATRS